MKQYAILTFLLIFVQSILAQNNYFIQLNTGVSLAQPKNALAYQYGAGFALFNFLTAKTSIETGINIERTLLNNYQNSVIHTSDWVNGPYDSYVNKTATIQQTHINVPIKYYHYVNQYFWGGGINFSYLVQSYTSQHINGTYSHPNYQGSEKPLTQSIKSVYEINDNRSLNNYKRTNISPVLFAGVVYKKKFLFSVSGEYTISKIPSYTNKIVPYRLLSLSVNSYIKLNQ